MDRKLILFVVNAESSVAITPHLPFSGAGGADLKASCLIMKVMDLVLIRIMIGRRRKDGRNVM